MKGGSRAALFDSVEFAALRRWRRSRGRPTSCRRASARARHGPGRRSAAPAGRLACRPGKSPGSHGPNPRPTGEAPARPEAAPRPSASANRRPCAGRPGRACARGSRRRPAWPADWTGCCGRCPAPAWNCSKCSSPFSAPRRIRNAHFSPISSTADGKRAAQRRRLECFDVRFDPDDLVTIQRSTSPNALYARLNAK